MSYDDNNLLGVQLNTSLTFSQLPELLQNIFPEQYYYKITEFKLLPLDESLGAPEFLFEIICWINIKQQDEIEQWKGLFEEQLIELDYLEQLKEKKYCIERFLLSTRRYCKY